ncbi:threonine transporter [Rhodococcus sp. MS16]|uniref:ABC-three component system middle component 2 n=1 Tax=Rhodococcus sp. MS16 TaxID=2579941 RepID=UPI001562A0B9|nr:ABC-three component system middle component 2 [Rhodococcus sp. MS16]NRI66039.1 threonine transporter [Rhodococcus sp. MS16]
MKPFNTPIEVAVRVLNVLAESHPRALDIGMLVMLDHVVLNTADLGGPPSIQPALPARVGQIAVKRPAIQHGLRVLLKANLVEPQASDSGIEYLAREESQYFLDLLDSSYAQKLATRSRWAIEHFGILSTAEMRVQMRLFLDAWVEEFDLSENSRTAQ